VKKSEVIVQRSDVARAAACPRLFESNLIIRLRKYVLEVAMRL
jgi:hypothetical protein